MSVNQGAIGGPGESSAHGGRGDTGLAAGAETPALTDEAFARLARAYLATYRGPHGDAPGADSAVTGPVDRTVAGVVSPAMVSAHYRLASFRPIGETRVAVYADDDPAGFGPALQIVTDNAAMLMDSATVLLHRLGVAYRAIMNPVFRVRRGPTGELLEIEPGVRCRVPRAASTRPGSTRSWRTRWTTSR
jgi:glutamate dehydrogenase